MRFNLAVFLVLLLVLGGFAPGSYAQAQAQVPQSAAQLQLSFAPVVRQVAPAVVNIYTRTIVKTRAPSALLEDPFFRQFFGNGFDFGQPAERVQNALGSGVIVAPDGLIVTNNHVIAGADQVTVILSDRREYEAKIVASEEKLDLALLRIDTRGEKLPTLALRNSDDIAVGDLVLAIGDPFGVGQTVTSGIVSGLARTQTGINDFGFFIQTDAAINPGNSGGALVTMDGKLIGINSAIYSRSGGSVGIGFAIPSNMVQVFLKAESHGGKLVTPWVGMSGETATADIAKAMHLTRPGGVVIREITPGSPAAQAGLRPGDVVVAVNGFEVADPQSLRFRLATLALNGAAELSIERRDGTHTVRITPIAPPRIPAPDERMLRGQQPLSGATVANLSPALAEDLGLNETAGVVVLKVQAGTYAARLGLARGDIIVAVDEERVTDTARLAALMANSDAPWNIKVQRNGRTSVLHIG
ncbi:MAG TPA: Do family serine endopeptidase [Dongiaceae bacterium]|jgi:serine protease Do|nr:Do family serine endopeptidase [Dongiaceae bacterium]